ncbi:sentrin-specific protease 6 isoform X3 [Danio rerio]|uniref:Sentrin-specific protease 6 isoform X3 n=1 Tax=Danio rerio TaxID=7955 RepID=A0A8M9PPW0_DANRE
MVRPLGQNRKNSLKVKPLKGNATGLNLLGMRTILANQTPSLVKTKGKRFIYALQSSWMKESRTDLSNSQSIDNETTDVLKHSVKDTQLEDFYSDILDHKKSTFKENDNTSLKILRKYRMRDEFGNLNPRVKRKTPAAKKKEPNSQIAQRLNSLMLNIRCLKVGTLTKTFARSGSLSTQCTFTVDCIEISSEAGRIEASDIVACEWCTVPRLPALFLQTTYEARLHLQVQLDMLEDDSEHFQNKNEKETCIVLIFENELTLPEQIILEDIFTEIGMRHNISGFLVKLPFEEANNKLKAQISAQKQIAMLHLEEDELPASSQRALMPFPPSPDAPRHEIATLSISDSDENDLMEGHSSPVQDLKKLLVYPPSPAKGGITVTEEDFYCLDEGEFLNDVIVDFYLRYLVCKQQEKKDTTQYHVFSSFFFKHLTQGNQKRHSGATSLSPQECRHDRVKTWTRNVNLFEKDFVFVPINQMSHWYLAVICFPGQISQTSGLDLSLNERRHSRQYLCAPSPPNPMSLFYSPESSKQLSRWSQSIDDLDQSFEILSDDEAEDDLQVVTNRSVLNRGSDVSKKPCILIMDSLTSSGRSSEVQILQQYLQEEWRVKMGSQQSFEKMHGWSPIVPKQDNYTDCGIYLLQYVESFLKDPPQAFHHNMDLKGWFSQRTVKRKRLQIKELILKLHRQQ